GAVEEKRRGRDESAAWERDLDEADTESLARSGGSVAREPSVRGRGGGRGRRMAQRPDRARRRAGARDRGGGGRAGSGPGDGRGPGVDRSEYELGRPQHYSTHRGPGADGRPG